MQPANTNSRGVFACVLGVACSLLAPGAGHLAVGADTRRASVITATAASIAATALLFLQLHSLGSHQQVADLVADRGRFLAVDVALLVMGVTRVWMAADVAWSTRPRGAGRIVIAATASACLIIGGVAPIALAADYVWRTDRAVERVFGTGDAHTATPGTLPANTTLGDHDPHPSSPSPAPTTSTTVVPFPGVDRINVLLLGGDAGAGRWSLRTDTMVVVSIDPDTGDTAMISVPRNLAGLPFPPGTALATRFPKGFPDLANAVYPYVNQRRELAGGGDDAGAQAIKLGIAQLLGVPIQYYVLVDMGGFIHVVDALGGIDLTTTRRVPAPGNPMEAKHLVPAWIEAGRQHFDGTLALSYARSRSADDDYRRMERQRCVLAGIASGATIRAIFTGLGDLVDAFGDSVRTDIPRDRLGDFVQIIERYTAAGGLNAVHTLILTPPVIQPSYWNLAHVRDLVKEVLAAPHPTNGTTTTVSATATPSTPGTTPGPTSGTTAGDTLGTECT